MPRDEFDQVNAQLNDMINKLWQWQASDFCPVDSWRPAMNLYRLERRIDVCLDLAGVDRNAIDVRVEPGQLTIRGLRDAPEPERGPDEHMRIVAMEIDHGRFCRIIALPDRVDLTRVESEYNDGMLWIHLPLRGPG